MEESSIEVAKGDSCYLLYKASQVEEWDNIIEFFSFYELCVAKKKV